MMGRRFRKFIAEIVNRTLFLQMTFDADQLVIAAQTTTLERLAT